MDWDERVDIGDGRSMRLRALGSGPATVLLDAGWGQWSASWGHVQQGLASDFRTLAFDRLGLGRSDPGVLPRTSYQIVDELEAALDARDFRGPFIYVGHAFGAVHGRVLCHRRDSVRGLVLVDPVVEALGVSPPFTKLRGQLSERYRGLRKWSRAGMLWPANVLLRRPRSARKMLKSQAKEVRRSFKPHVIDAMLEEFAALEESMDQLSRLGVPSIPFEVLSAAQDWLQTPAKGQETAVQSMHRKLAERSEKGAHQVVAQTSHDVHLDVPDAVIEAVRRVARRCDLTN